MVKNAYKCHFFLTKILSVQIFVVLLQRQNYKNFVILQRFSIKKFVFELKIIHL